MAKMRKRGRAWACCGLNNNKTYHIITFFPFGQLTDRKYPTHRLREILRQLSLDRSCVIVLCGSAHDTADIVDIVSGEYEGLDLDKNLKTCYQQPMPVILDLIMGSDVVVAMDSGPLHLARTLRVKPIALYTDKVNDPERFLAFPWYVDDDTVDALIPPLGDTHVTTDQIVSEIKKRLSNIILSDQAE